MIYEQPAEAHVRPAREIAHGDRGRQQDGPQPQRDRRWRMQDVDDTEGERGTTDDQQPLTPRQPQVRDGRIDVPIRTVTHDSLAFRRVRDLAGG